jgi:hypothetical protein
MTTKITTRITTEVRNLCHYTYKNAFEYYSELTFFTFIQQGFLLLVVFENGLHLLFFLSICYLLTCSTLFTCDLDTTGVRNKCHKTGKTQLSGDEFGLYKHKQINNIRMRWCQERIQERPVKKPRLDLPDVRANWGRWASGFKSQEVKAPQDGVESLTQLEAEGKIIAPAGAHHQRYATFLRRNFPGVFVTGQGGRDIYERYLKRYELDRLESWVSIPLIMAWFEDSNALINTLPATTLSSARRIFIGSSTEEMLVNAIRNDLIAGGLLPDTTVLTSGHDRSAYFRTRPFLLPDTTVPNTMGFIIEMDAPPGDPREDIDTFVMQITRQEYTKAGSSHGPKTVWP